MRFGLGGRGPWWGLIAGVTVLGIIEAAVLHWVAAALLPPGGSLAVDLVVGLATVALLVVFASPLWSSHRITGQVVRLRLGWVAGARVPLDAVRSVVRVTTGPARPAELGAGFDADTGRVSMVRAPSSELVLLEFSRPVTARVQLAKRVEASAVLVAVDDAEELIQAVSSTRSDMPR